jgi:hypothetical protein
MVTLPPTQNILGMGYGRANEEKIHTPTETIRTNIFRAVGFEGFPKGDKFLYCSWGTCCATKECLDIRFILIRLGRILLGREGASRFKEIRHENCSLQGRRDNISALLSLRKISSTS